MFTCVVGEKMGCGSVFRSLDETAAQLAAAVGPAPFARPAAEPPLALQASAGYVCWYVEAPTRLSGKSITFDATRKINIGVEYYGAFGPIGRFDPASLNSNISFTL